MNKIITIDGVSKFENSYTGAEQQLRITYVQGTKVLRIETTMTPSMSLYKTGITPYVTAQKAIVSSYMKYITYNMRENILMIDFIDGEHLTLSVAKTSRKAAKKLEKAANNVGKNTLIKNTCCVKKPVSFRT